MTTLEQVAGAILCRVIDAMTMGTADETDMEMAMTICDEQRDNADLIELIEECTEIADQSTDGIFSATLQSKRAVMQ